MLGGDEVGENTEDVRRVILICGFALDISTLYRGISLAVSDRISDDPRYLIEIVCFMKDIIKLFTRVLFVFYSYRLGSAS